jgi:hypothetical protein
MMRGRLHDRTDRSPCAALRKSAPSCYVHAILDLFRAGSPGVARPLAAPLSIKLISSSSYRIRHTITEVSLPRRTCGGTLRLARGHRRRSPGGRGIPGRRGPAEDHPLPGESPRGLLFTYRAPGMSATRDGHQAGWLARTAISRAISWSPCSDRFLRHYFSPVSRARVRPAWLCCTTDPPVRSRQAADRTLNRKPGFTAVLILVFTDTSL